MMKKWNRRIFLSVLIVSSVYAVTHVLNPEHRIRNFVNKNSKELVTIAEAYLNSDTTTKTYKGVEVEQVFSGSHDIVQFYCYGVGIVPASKYYGFYYSPDDVPVAYQNVYNESLYSVSDDEWEWSDGTDNGGRTIKILEDWYYYAAWF